MTEKRRIDENLVLEYITDLDNELYNAPVEYFQPFVDGLKSYVERNSRDYKSDITLAGTYGASPEFLYSISVGKLSSPYLLGMEGFPDTIYTIPNLREAYVFHKRWFGRGVEQPHTGFDDAYVLAALYDTYLRLVPTLIRTFGRVDAKRAEDTICVLLLAGSAGFSQFIVNHDSSALSEDFYVSSTTYQSIVSKRTPQVAACILRAME